MSITYVTGNYGKYVSVRNRFDGSDIDVRFYEHDFEEPEVNDIEIISKAKVIEAYKILQSPCFVIDSGFYIDCYPGSPGYPGAFVKRSGVSSNIDELLLKMKDVKNRSCTFIDCLTFYDGYGFYTFYDKDEGTLTYEKRGNKKECAKSNLWYIYIPNDSNKTLAEMTDNERKERSNNKNSVTLQFLEWYKNSYLKRKVKVIK